MKQAFRNSAIYAGVAGLVYLILHVLPPVVGFYGLLLFYMVHLPGVALAGLAIWALNVESDGAWGRLLTDIVPIAVNAAFVFFLTWVRTRA